MRLVDSHAHLDYVEDLEAALDRAKAERVGTIITVGASIKSSKKAVENAWRYSVDDLRIYTTAGIHPKDGKADVEKYGLLHCFETLKQLVGSSRKVVAIGECGLDYYVDGDKKHLTTDKERGFQKELFEGQIKLAADLGLPLVIHCRNAWDDIFKILTINHKLLTIKGVFHSWTGDWVAARKALDLGFYISFSGIVTFKNTLYIQEVAKKIPIEQMLIETDSPYLSPEPVRGFKNEPKNVKIVAQFLANLRNQPFDTISFETSKNAQRLFSIL